MEEFIKYYLKDVRLNDLYQNGNNRVKNYLRLIFERSYLLFVNHLGDMHNGFWDELNSAKSTLSQDDLHFLAKYGAGIYAKEYVIQGILDRIGPGDSEYDTVDVILREWRIPENVHYFAKDDIPPLLQEWLDIAKKEFLTIEQIEGNWYLKHVGISFIFDEIWYRIFPSDLGINNFTFDNYAEEIMLSLQSYGARFTRYEGMID